VRFADALELAKRVLFLAIACAVNSDHKGFSRICPNRHR